MRQLMKYAACAAAALSVLTGVAAAEDIAIVNGRLLLAGPADNPQTIDNGGVLISDGKIVAVGPNVVAPAGATVIDAQGQPVSPGLFAVLSGIGLEEISLNGEGNDTGTRGSFPLSAALDASDAINPDSTVIPVNRAGGVTRAYVTTNAGDTLFGGCGSVIDLSGDMDPITTPCVAQKVVMGYSGARKTGDNKAGAMALLRSYLEEALVYNRNPDDYRFMMAANELTQMDLAALAPYARGRKPLLVEVESAPDILRLLKMKEEYGLDMILYSAREAWRVADRIAAADVPVIINPLDNLPSRFEAMAATLENAARLERAGVTVAFYDSDIGYTHALFNLTQLAGNAVANGMSYEEALAAISLNPAKIWGLEGDLGTLQAGKTADIVVWSGDPLELSSYPVAVLVNGEETSLDNRQTALAKRYKDLTRGDKPLAYRGN